MSSGTFSSFGRLILQIALGAMLAVSGIWALQGQGDAAVFAIRGFFEGNLQKILVIAFGVIELLAGILLLVALLGGGNLRFANLLMTIVLFVWIVAIILGDFLGNSGILQNGFNDFLKWLYGFSQHLIVLGAMLYLKN